MIERDVVDGVRVLRKRPGYDVRTEVEGLTALREAGAHVPRVVRSSADELVIEEVGGDGDWAACGRRLAGVHDVTADRFGWHRDGVIGTLPMGNRRDPDWVDFFVGQRVLPYTDGLPAALRGRLLDAVDDGRARAVLDHDVVPSLVHGDLWSGNVVGGQWLVDPAVHHADRELDLAMARLFGGIPEAFFAAYAEVAPLDDGWRERLPALQLFHLLVHVELFGGPYPGMVAVRLDTLGW